MSKWLAEISDLSDRLYDSIKFSETVKDRPGMTAWMHCDGYPEKDEEILILASQVLEER